LTHFLQQCEKVGHIRSRNDFAALNVRQAKRGLSAAIDARADRGGIGRQGRVLLTTATIAIGIYPYLRNLVLFHNPIYPFLFGHPGIPDEYMAGLKAEFSNPLDPAFLKYSQNLLTVAGWRDFAIAAWEMFLSAWKLKASVLVVIAAGLFFLRSRALVHFAAWTLCMWVFWYTVGSMHYRWGLSPMMLLLTMTLLVFMELIDRTVDKIALSGNIPRSRHDPKIPGRYDAKVVGD
jgi:hypothetical protein